MNTLFYILKFKWSQFSSVTQSSLTLCDPMDCLSITISWNLLNSRPSSWWCHQPSYPLSSPSPPAFNLSKHQGLCSESVLHIRWPNYWDFQLQHQSFQCIFRTDFFYEWLVWSLCSPWDPQESSPILQFKSISFSAHRFLYSPTLTFTHDHWKNHSFDQMDFSWQSNISPF